MYIEPTIQVIWPIIKFCQTEIIKNLFYIVKSFLTLEKPVLKDHKYTQL